MLRMCYFGFFGKIVIFSKHVHKRVAKEVLYISTNDKLGIIKARIYPFRFSDMPA